jgi:hypothetical protein
MTDEELIERYQKGERLGDIAAAANCKMMTISNRLNSLRPIVGYRQEPMSTTHPVRYLAAIRRKLAVQLREQDVPTPEIAKRTGYSENYVHQIAPAVNRNYDILIRDIESQLVEGTDQRATPTDGNADACVARPTINIQRREI